MFDAQKFPAVARYMAHIQLLPEWRRVDYGAAAIIKGWEKHMQPHGEHADNEQNSFLTWTDMPGQRESSSSSSSYVPARGNEERDVAEAEMNGFLTWADTPREH